MRAFHARDWGSNPHSSTPSEVGIPNTIKYMNMVTKDHPMSRTNPNKAHARFERPFHCIKLEYGQNSISTALYEKRITREDADLIREFTAERQAIRQLSDGRVNKIIYHLVDWRNYIGIFTKNAITDIHQGINRLNMARIRGRPYKRNTLHDKIEFLRQFYVWLVEIGKVNIPLARVTQIRPPTIDRITKNAAQLLTADEIESMIRSCLSARDRALVSMLYEGGFRVIEVGTLTWEQVHFDEYGCIVDVCKKTLIPRKVRLTASTHYLKQWMNEYPLPLPKKSNPKNTETLVFLTSQNNPLQYEGVAKNLRNIAKRAGIEKKVTPHLFRHSRITHLAQQGTEEVVIKKTMWGHINTSQYATYCHVDDEMVDNMILKRQGLLKPQKTNLHQFAPKACVHCETINPPTAHYCVTCEQPLDAETIAGQDDLIQYIEKHPDLMQILKRAGMREPAVS
jgi:integrase/recombinase XerD